MSPEFEEGPDEGFAPAYYRLIPLDAPCDHHHHTPHKWHANQSDAAACQEHGHLREKWKLSVLSKL